ncbi:MAG: class I SAM-dependent methyltransferase [Lachnospiraceae bacterium]|nr:class I SAM-dependent methyltransferase [Lachnospiraceae bacterium]
MADSYNEFAYVYDELMDAVPYEEWCERIAHAIDSYGITKRVRDPESEDSFEEECEELTEPTEEELLESERNLVVDLGCGTGTVTEMLYSLGFDMIGIDNSEEMLEIAMEKKCESGSEILYLNQDMLELELFSTVGTVISVCDSLNYLVGDGDLETVFSLVSNYLYPGGLFIFDLNTDYKYREIIGNRTIAESREDCSFIWDNLYDSEKKINEYDLTLFIEGEDGRFDRFLETHYQKGYDPAEVKKILEDNKFEIVKMTDSETGGDVSDVTQRIFVVAKSTKEKNQNE